MQLLSRGLFPCAPTEPSLSVDLNVLDFARELFVNAAPNTTAWCDTLEGFLSSRKFKLTTRVSYFYNAMSFNSYLLSLEYIAYSVWQCNALVCNLVRSKKSYAP